MLPARSNLKWDKFLLMGKKISLTTRRKAWPSRTWTRVPEFFRGREKPCYFRTWSRFFLRRSCMVSSELRRLSCSVTCSIYVGVRTWQPALMIVRSFSGLWGSHEHVTVVLTAEYSSRALYAGRSVAFPSIHEGLRCFVPSTSPLLPVIDGHTKLVVCASRAATRLPISVCSLLPPVIIILVRPFAGRDYASVQL